MAKHLIHYVGTYGNSVSICHAALVGLFHIPTIIKALFIQTVPL
jgi:hypothetical protein